ncbi:MAG: hypothetical protein N2053_09265 [Chitinispirillaceae bacterium]|nr:hypothetical protein [Chitinispirillaceae bacterium]
MKFTKSKIFKTNFRILGQSLFCMSILLLNIPLRSDEKLVDKGKEAIMSIKKDSLFHNFTNSNVLLKIREIISLESGSIITIPFPEHWPPQQPKVAYYIYRYGSPAKTSRIATSIGSPSLKIIVSLTGKGDLEISTLKLESKPLPILEPISFAPSDTSKKEEVLSLLFKSIAICQIPDKDSSYKIKQLYKEWIASHPGLYSYFMKFYPEFFNWIKSEE